MELDRTKAQREVFEEKYLILFDFISGHDLVMDFAVVEIVGEQIEPKPGGTLYSKDDGGPSDDGTLDLSDADTFLRGSIKWDGCSNWEFPDTSNCMLHFCGQNDATSIGRLMTRMYEITAEKMPKFDKDLAR